MNFDTITEPDVRLAREKWKEYKAAEKLSKAIPGQEGIKYRSVYKELGKIYHAMKQGKVLIDIRDVIKAAGLKNGRPAFAIARAHTSKVNCRYNENGSVWYDESYWESKASINLGIILPEYGQKRIGWGLDMNAPVPMIPPKYRPANLTDDYYILWEVDEWSNVTSVDPYLLKRLTKYHFIVLEGWDLTPLEVSVMNNYLK